MMRSQRSQAGVALIEFALVLPLLIMLLIGIVEVGRLAYYNILVGNAAYAGAIYGSRNRETAQEASNIIAAALKDGQNIPQLQVSPAPLQVCQCYNAATGSASSLSCSLNGSTCASGSHPIMYVEVTATATINTLFNYSALGIPNPWTITRTAKLRVINTTQ